MTTMLLQEELEKEVERVLKDIICKSVKGELTHIKAFAQNLPKKVQNVSAGQVNPKKDDDPYPFCVIELEGGSVSIPESMQEVSVTFTFGIYDDDVQCQGHKVILTMIQRITERFIKNPVLNGKYRMNHNVGVTWVLDNKDRYPYYFGAMEMTFSTFFTGREGDRYA